MSSYTVTQNQHDQVCRSVKTIGKDKGALISDVVTEIIHSLNIPEAHARYIVRSTLDKNLITTTKEFYLLVREPHLQ
jgi:hypothetical protein